MVLVSYILDIYIGILQTKFSYRERHEARCVGLEAVPLDQHIEGGHGERQARLKIPPAPMHHLLQMADERQHREHRLHQHPVLPLPALTQFQVAGIPLRGMEAGVAQDDHSPINLLNQPLKGVVRNIRGGTRPPHDQPPLVEQQTEFPADNPAVVRHAFAADLLRAPAFTHRVDQLDPIGVDDPEDRRGGQEGCRPVLMGLEEAKEPRPLGEPREKCPIVACQPAIKRPVAHAFERMQQPQGDHLAGPEVGLGTFGDGGQLLIDLVEQRRDKIDGGHRLLRTWQGCTLATSLEEVHDYDNRASMYYYLLLVCKRLIPLVTIAPCWRTSASTWAPWTRASRRWPRHTPCWSNRRTAGGKRKCVASGASCSSSKR